MKNIGTGDGLANKNKLVWWVDSVQYIDYIKMDYDQY